ncbi:bifunctional oligoribonuclease/PAP phosphatase NrnA [Anabaenopsis sp. FSS-46]|uniref:DHH family phosphoesterase n=1 Tax=Anabaenopsis sp. FSS-46 TaxID=2971766 RepID=UPI0024767757|nr:bifunctional oligoribonuclease/PAP phosphatase NrnA [Anabaenopsis sp. FSS-46]MDH6098888.1 bifunctional oligoribonuclease/PAP phosphatase NrnA [Anabaenopsis sp. FSS-46]
MQLNSAAQQSESFLLTTEPSPEDATHRGKEPFEVSHTKPSLISSHEEGKQDRYLGQRGNSSAFQKSEELQKILFAHRHERHLVILQDFPDPDALSCAWTYQLIVQQYDIKCEIIYAGTLSHQENIALVKLTGLPAQRWTSQVLKSKDLSSYQGCILIDNQGTTSQLMTAVQQAEIPVIAVIDHHTLQAEHKSEFVDIRPNVRATSTIFTQYLQSGLLSLDSSISQHVKCATALMHGLRSDTNRLMQAQEEDFMAAAYLSRFYDAQLLNAILQANRSKRVMDVIERSLKNRIVQNNFSIAGVGYLRYEDRDAIPQAADFLVTEENVHTAVVYGIVHDENEVEVVIGSLRTAKLTLDPDEFIKEAFGQDSTGRFFGGGRTGAGGFEIPMGFLSGSNENSTYAKMKWEVYDSQIKQKLLKLVNPQDDPIKSV